MTATTEQPADVGQDTPADKTPAQSLSLRARPPRAVMLKRGLLIGAVGIGAAGLCALAWLALSPKVLQVAKPPAEPVADRGAPAQAVSQLPSDYSQASAAPQLGPPLPGDLGRAVLDQQRREGLVAGVEAPETPPRLTPQQQAALAEGQRLQSQARQAREAGVMVQMATRTPTLQTTIDQSMATPITASPPATATAAPDPNGQDRKTAFMERSRSSDIYNSHQLETPRSPFQVMAGSVIAASLITGLDSDLPGLVTAQVTENVFDSATGRFLLIPQGARLMGRYDSVVAYGQGRALLVWQRIILPDGSSIQLDNLPATDAAGYAGVADKVDFHTWRLLQGVALSTLLGVGTELSLGDDESDLVRAIRQSTQQSASQAGQQIVSQQLNVQPTIRVRPGWPLRVVVHKDLILRPWKAS
jgi:type IV secretion system protein VirB10